MLNNRSDAIAQRREMYSALTKQFMTGPMLTVMQSLGIQQVPISKNCVALNDGMYAYLAGKHIVVRDQEEKIVVRSISDEEVSIFAVAARPKSLRFLVSLLQDRSSITQMPPIVKVYQTQSSISFQLLHSHVGNNKGMLVTDACFYRKGKKILTLASNNDKSIVSSWHSRQQQPLIFGEFGFMALKVVGFSTAEDELYTASKDEIQLFELAVNDTIILISRKRYNRPVLSACKVRAKPFAAFLSVNSFVYLRNWEQESVIDLEARTLAKPSVMISYSRGFIVGYEFNPQLEIIHIDEYNELPSIVQTVALKISHFVKCLSLDMALDERMFICCTEASLDYLQQLSSRYQVGSVKDFQSESSRDIYFERQAYQDSIVSLDVFKIDFTVPIKSVTPLLQNQCHRQSIISIVECPLTSTVLTLSQDRQLKTWQMKQRRLHLRQSHTLQNNPRCMDVHPTCFMVAIGCLENFKVYVLTEELNTLYQAPLKHCNQVSFSKEGHLLAISYQTENLRVMNSYTFEVVVQAVFPHTIVELQWTFTTTRMIILTSDQTFCCFSKSIEFELTPKVAGKVCCFAYDDIVDHLLFCTDRGELYVYNDKMRKMSYFMVIQPHCTYIKVQIVPEMKAIFFLTSLGSIRVYLWPFTDLLVAHQSHLEIAVHQGQGSALLVSRGGLAITGGIDASVMCAAIEMYERGQPQQLKPREAFASPIGICFKPYHWEVRQDLRDQEYRLETLSSQTKLQKDNYRNRLEQLENSKMLEAQFLGKKVIEDLDKYKQAHFMKRKKMEKQIKRLQVDHTELLARTLQSNELDLLQIQHNNADLIGRIEREEQVAQQELEAERKRCEEELNAVQVDEQARLSAEVHKLRAQQTVYESSQHVSKEMMEQQQADHSLHIRKLVEKSRTELTQLRLENENLKLSIARTKKDIYHTAQRSRDLAQIIEQGQRSIAEDKLRQEHHQYQTTNIETQLSNIEKRLSTKEMEISKLNKYKYKLRLYKETLQYREEEQQEEIKKHKLKILELEQAEAEMEQKLLEQASIQKQVIEDSLQSSLKKVQAKDELRGKKEIISVSKRRLELLEYDILQTIRENEPHKIKPVLIECFAKYFKPPKETAQEIYLTQQVTEDKLESETITKMRDHQNKLLMHNLHQNELQIKHSDSKNSLYNKHYSRLLEELNELKREHHTFGLEYQRLLRDFKEANDEIIALGDKPIQMWSLDSRSMSPPRRSGSPRERLSPLLTPYQELKARQDQIPLNPNSPRGSILPMELNSVRKISFNQLTAGNAKVIRLGQKAMAAMFGRAGSPSINHNPNPIANALSRQSSQGAISPPQERLQEHLVANTLVPRMFKKRSKSPT